MARRYSITIEEQLDAGWSSWFDGLSITHGADGSTTLEGPVRDQSALYGLLAKARDLGLIRLIGAELWGTPEMTRETRTAGMLLTTTARAVDAQSAEGRERASDDARLLAGPWLGERPLIVLASEQNMAATPYWAEAQRKQVALSVNGLLSVPAGSGHYIHWEQPALVIDALRQVVAEVRGR